MVFQVTQNSDRTQLLSAIQNDTTGLEGLSRFNVSLIGDGRAFGSFSSDPFKLGTGIALSTGRVSDLPGINTADGRNIYAGGPVADFMKDLSTDFPPIAPEGDPRGEEGDKIQLKIDFFADDRKDTLYFQYVFGSEEFKEFAGRSFNDQFSLSLNGTNFATLPGGDPNDKLVTINNLLNSPAASGKPYYIDNPVNTGPASDQTRLDGYTVPLTFQAPLQKNKMNTLIIEVKDVGDGRYDSAVFIKAGTLGTRRPPDIDGSGVLVVAKEDIYSTVQSTPLVIDASRGVLANDANPTSATLNATLVTSPQNGSLALNTDGSFRYTPTPNFIGTDRFTYKDTTSLGESLPATVTIEVIPTPTPTPTPTPIPTPTPTPTPTPITDIIGTPGRDVLVGTNLAERIIGLQAGDILTGGGGKDQFIYQNINEAGDRITDFTIGEDKIVLSGVFQSINYYGSNPITDGIISFRQANVNLAILQIDPDGPNNAAFRPVPFILFDNISVDDLSNPSNFIV
ncbi:MAG: choice-of-anchor L domain-containing protein [Myxacorys chilensis ATA2-1-KO14]|jgi:hypothetical protein|nr:choice-of-anchor L domain-containing protein [Myxacorys chilensis ATA2-1-KO14]